MSDTGINAPEIFANEPIRQVEETAALAARADEPTATSIGRLSFKTLGATALAPVIGIDRLYEAPPGATSQMLTALELLKSAIDFLSEARKSQSPMDSDRFVQRAQLTLPGLFACRAIGDGFGVIINSLHFAFVNLRGTPLKPDQLDVIWRIMRELRARPAMSLEQGIQRVEELENSGLEVDPPDVANLLEGYEATE